MAYIQLVVSRVLLSDKSKGETLNIRKNVTSKPIYQFNR